MDKIKFAKSLIDNRKSASVGLCARYVRLALKEAGVDIVNYPPSAHLYKGVLPKYGFELIGINMFNFAPQIGDIVVWNRNESSQHGHIQGYTEQGWCSDFLQLTIYPNSRKAEIWRKGGNYVFRIRTK